MTEKLILPEAKIRFKRFFLGLSLLVSFEDKINFCYLKNVPSSGTKKGFMSKISKNRHKVSRIWSL